MESDYRPIYEKLWLAHEIYLASWDGSKYRMYAEDPVQYVLSAADRQTGAYAQYAWLGGRSPEFFAFIGAVLGITEANRDAVRATLWEQWATPAVRAFVRKSLETHKLLAWPLPVSEGVTP